MGKNRERFGRILKALSVGSSFLMENESQVQLWGARGTTRLDRLFSSQSPPVPTSRTTRLLGRPERPKSFPRLRAELRGSSSEGCSKRTNLENKSLTSADRSNKATLLLTVLCFVFKSSAKDLSPPIFHVSIKGTHKSSFPSPTETHCIILDAHEVRLFVID